MTRPARRASLIAVVALACAATPAAVVAATTTTVMLAVSSTVAAPPGTCLLSPVAAPAGTAPSPAFSVAVACSGSDPYVVSADGTVPLVVSGTGDRTGGVARTFTVPDAGTAPDRAARRAFTATVQY